MLFIPVHFHLRHFCRLYNAGSASLTPSIDSSLSTYQAIFFVVGCASRRLLLSNKALNHNPDNRGCRCANPRSVLCLRLYRRSPVVLGNIRLAEVYSDRSTGWETIKRRHPPFGEHLLHDFCPSQPRVIAQLLRLDKVVSRHSHQRVECQTSHRPDQSLQVIQGAATRDHQLQRIGYLAALALCGSNAGIRAHTASDLPYPSLLVVPIATCAHRSKQSARLKEDRSAVGPSSFAIWRLIMRLLNTSTLRLESFFGCDLPIYAILSHTWGKEEVTLQDMSTPSEAEKLAGYVKLRGCCKKAVEDGYSHVWIDTCCIDKTSSAELSEAINSMYMWYKKADICYAYLADVEVPFSVESSHGDGLHVLPETFKRSRWFSRGWTLQELIAPKTVEFYTADWDEIGTKQSLRDEIALITGIDSRILEGRDPSAYHVAERMSWAASRTTTRVEDISYCLLGIFKIHMPLLYGEGKRAFIRLQEEILRTTDDYTILARSFHLCMPSGGWSDNLLSIYPVAPLATEISEFQTSGYLDEQPYRKLKLGRDTSASGQRAQAGGSAQYPLTLTARGLFITLPMRKLSETLSAVYLHCNLRRSDEIVCMVLAEVSPGCYHRAGTFVHNHQPYVMMPAQALSSFIITSFYIQQEFPPLRQRPNLVYRSYHRKRIVVEVDPTGFRAQFKFFTNEESVAIQSGWPLIAHYPSVPSTYPKIMCALEDNDSFIVKFGSSLVWGVEQYWCHCFFDPHREVGDSWGLHLNHSSPAERLLMWEHFSGFIPKKPSDRFQGSLRSKSGTVSVSIKETNFVSGGGSLEKRVVVKIRIERHEDAMTLDT